MKLFVVVPDANIASVALSAVGDETEIPSSVTFYGFGETDDNAAGEVLTSFGLSLESNEGSIIASSDDGAATKFDLGAPLVISGKQVAVLVKPGDGNNAGTFEPVSPYFDWIETETGLVLSPEEVAPEDPETEAKDSLRVQFVN